MAYASDPVHMDPDGQWFFYTECLTKRYGPFPTPDVAYEKVNAYIVWLNEQAQAAKPAAPAEPSPADRTVAEYLRLRDLKAEIAARHKLELADVEKEIQRADTWLLDHLQKAGVDSFATGDASVYTSYTPRGSIADKEALTNFVRDSGNTELLQPRLSSSALKQFMDNNQGAVPPGVKVDTVRSVVVRRK